MTAGAARAARPIAPPGRPDAGADGEPTSLPTAAARDDAPCGPREPEDRRTSPDAGFHALQAQLTGGLSTSAQCLAGLDWSLHMANAPLRRLDLAADAWTGAARFLHAAATGETVIEPGRTDYRFRDPAWRTPPFHALAQGFLLSEAWWAGAMTGLPGVGRGHERLVAFAARQVLDMMAPSNHPLTNPEILRETAASRGANFLRGWINLLTDLGEMTSGHAVGEGAPQVGTDIAATPGRVVLRNDLIELIQYAPSTAVVTPEPVLIVPAWIMKYYVLDLSPGNSLIRWLVGRGRTVFVISWRNPGAELRETSFDDYRRLGVMEALEAVAEICGGRRVHGCGYCLGGTLLSVAAAQMARDGDHRLASLTLLAAQTDFAEAGELQLFVTEAQLALLEDLMQVRGYLESREMAGAFHLLRSNDLIWSRIVKTYLMGRREHPSDLMAWNADGTRMPARMHSQYLRQMFLENALAQGRVEVGGRPVALNDIRLPIFALGTETDHVAPWRSVHKIHLLCDAETTFALTTGGHNAGVVSEPGHRRRSFRIATRPEGGRYVGPDEWCAGAELREGSWWPAWDDWLSARSGTPGPPPPTGSAAYPPIEAAPGLFVHER